MDQRKAALRSGSVLASCEKPKCVTSQIPGRLNLNPACAEGLTARQVAPTIGESNTTHEGM